MANQKILIIDDVPDHCDAMSRVLRLEGYRVIVAMPGRDALEKAQRERPDLILATLSLPGQPAWETTRALSAIPALATTPILGTTVYSTLLSPARVRAIGCADCVEKPFELDGLLHRIGRLIRPMPFAVA